jgi:hypothetical protein
MLWALTSETLPQMVATTNESQRVTASLERELEGVSPHTVQALLTLLRTVKGKRVQGAYTARALVALRQLVESAEPDALIDATGAPSDFGVLVDVLNRPEVVERLKATDPLAPARLRGLRAKERLLAAEGGTLSATEVAQVLGISRQAVDLRRKRGKLIGLVLGRHSSAYPAWQFGPEGVLPGLEGVLAELQRFDPWMQVAFMLGANDLLEGETPLAELRRGNLDGVRGAAQLFGEHIAT